MHGLSAYECVFLQISLIVYHYCKALSTDKMGFLQVETCFHAKESQKAAKKDAVHRFSACTCVFFAYSCSLGGLIGYFFFQVEGDRASRRGTISNRPKSMAKDSTTVEKGEYAA